jgi:hypothetical protein
VTRIVADLNHPFEGVIVQWYAATYAFDIMSAVPMTNAWCYLFDQTATDCSVNENLANLTYPGIDNLESWQVGHITPPEQYVSPFSFQPAIWGEDSCGLIEMVCGRYLFQDPKYFQCNFIEEYK